MLESRGLKLAERVFKIYMEIWKTPASLAATSMVSTSGVWQALVRLFKVL